MPADMKAHSYQNDCKKDCPIISSQIAFAIKNYALERGVNFDNIDYYEHLKHNKKNKDWIDRNIICHNIITNMRQKGIPSIECEGKYKGLPTIEELKLISLLSTTMSKNELLEIAKKLKNPVSVKYVLKKIK